MQNEQNFELTIEEVSRASGISHWKLRRWIKAGTVTGFRRIGSLILFPPGTVIDATAKPPKVKA